MDEPQDYKHFQQTIPSGSESASASTKPKSKSSKSSESKFFIALHLGAGSHSYRKKDTYKALCKSACGKAILILKRGGSADEAVVAATLVLEDSGLVNAGRGSNLTIDKKVECDAGFMSGDGYFGGVGAVPGVRNPILIAKKLVELQEDPNKLSCGRVPPTLLAGTEAKVWAASQGILTCDNKDLICKKAASSYEKYMKRIAGATEAKLDLSEKVGDTVGAIALDLHGKVAATVSSGGNWLKFPGRVGHSPQFGSGCWASNRDTDHDSAVGISTSGVGEMLSKVQWASTCAASLRDPGFPTSVQSVFSSIKDKFQESNLLRHHKEPKLLGMISLTWDGARGEFIWAHTSQTFVVAYGGTGFRKVKMEMSALPTEVGKTVKVDSISI